MSADKWKAAARALESHKVRENRIRRVAKRRGFELRKSPRRDPYALDYGTYKLFSTATKSRVFPAPHAPRGQYGASLADVEAALEALSKPRPGRG